MNKILGIIVQGLLLNGNAYAECIKQTTYHTNQLWLTKTIFFRIFIEDKVRIFAMVCDELNAIYKWKGNSGYGYLYPRDRDMFEDSELGMEQKACYFIVVIQVLLKFLKPE